MSDNSLIPISKEHFLNETATFVDSAFGFHGWKSNSSMFFQLQGYIIEKCLSMPVGETTHKSLNLSFLQKYSTVVSDWYKELTI